MGRLDRKLRMRREDVQDGSAAWPADAALRIEWRLDAEFKDGRRLRYAVDLRWDVDIWRVSGAVEAAAGGDEPDIRIDLPVVSGASGDEVLIALADQHRRLADAHERALALLLRPAEP